MKVCAEEIDRKFPEGNSNSTDLRIAKATAKFHELENVLRDSEIYLSIRKKFLEACVRPRLTFATQSWRLSEIEIKKLESCWHGFLRRMVKGGFRNKPTELQVSTAISHLCILVMKAYISQRVVRYESSLTPNILNT